MIDVATLSVIRRWALREQLSIREIARRTGVSRNTIRKYLRAGEAEPRYPKRVSRSGLDPFALHVAVLLSALPSRPPAAAPSFPWPSARARPSSSTGAKTGQCWPECAPSCR